jgi:hypothetical protein
MSSSLEVNEELKAYMKEKKTQKVASFGRPLEFGEVETLRDDVYEDEVAQEMGSPFLGKRVCEGSGRQDSGKKAKGKGPKNLFFFYPETRIRSQVETNKRKRCLSQRSKS